jgi:hypothetical protein
MDKMTIQGWLTFGQRFDRGSGEGGFLDAKAWINQHQPFRKKFG